MTAGRIQWDSLTNQQKRIILWIRTGSTTSALSAVSRFISTFSLSFSTDCFSREFKLKLKCKTKKIQFLLSIAPEIWFVKLILVVFFIETIQSHGTFFWILFIQRRCLVCLNSTTNNNCHNLMLNCASQRSTAKIYSVTSNKMMDQPILNGSCVWHFVVHSIISLSACLFVLVNQQNIRKSFAKFRCARVSVN